METTEIEIVRSEYPDIKRARNWILIFGRRKVGKTFLIRKFIKPNKYFIVRTDGTIADHSIKEFTDEVKSLLENGKTVAIDEFQRLPDTILEDIVSVHPHGKLILSGSSLQVVNRIFNPLSPLLGFLGHFQLDLIKPKDILSGLKQYFSPDQTIELASILRDPWTIPVAQEEKDVLRRIYKLLTQSKHIIPALIGEIFKEEHHILTKTYQSILKCIGSGVWQQQQLASLLFSKGIIKNANIASISNYVSDLVKMGLLENISIYKSKSRYLKLKSAIMGIFYYLADRYDFDERDVSFEELKPTLEKLRNLAVQDFIADLFAEQELGEKCYYFSPDKELDFIILKRNKPILVGEVKWGEAKQADLDHFKKNSGFISAKKVFVTKKAQLSNADIEVYTASDLVEKSS